MIVVENEVTRYFWLGSGHTDAARAARRRDSDGHAPRLWQSEFRNGLYQHMQHRELSVSEALRLAEVAEADREEAIDSVATTDVLRRTGETGPPASNCEYVARTRDLGVTLVTGDETVVGRFPDPAVLLEDCASP
jgi:predicted nucleic acid-binding protein